jgi:hypothetical protein
MNLRRMSLLTPPSLDEARLSLKHNGRQRWYLTAEDLTRYGAHPRAVAPRLVW